MVHFNTGACFGGQVVSLITYTSIVTPQRPMTFVLPVLFFVLYLTNCDLVSWCGRKEEYSA